LAALVVVSVMATGACGEVTPVARTALDIARDLCALTVGEREGIATEEAVRTFCATEAQLEPWLDELLATKQRMAARAPGAGP
jgi:hypothetical protein